MTRTLLHRRTVAYDGYQREDGALELEARLSDTTAVQTPMPFGDLEAGANVHAMHIAMTVEPDLVIREVRALTETGATPYCGGSDAAYARLAGLKIAAGFRQAVRERVGGVQGCTHLTELVLGLGHAAMQTWFSVRRAENRAIRLRQPAAAIPRPWVAGTCHAYREDGEAMRVVWPPDRRSV